MTSHQVNALINENKLIFRVFDLTMILYCAQFFIFVLRFLPLFIMINHFIEYFCSIFFVSFFCYFYSYFCWFFCPFQSVDSNCLISLRDQVLSFSSFRYFFEFLSFFEGALIRPSEIFDWDTFKTLHMFM